MAVDPFAIASDSGPMPSSFVRLGLAPAFSSSSAIADVAMRVAAHASAVVPSSSRAFTSAPWRSSAATAA